MKVAFIVAIHLISLVAYTQDGKTRMESDASRARLKRKSYWS